MLCSFQTRAAATAAWAGWTILQVIQTEDIPKNQAPAIEGWPVFASDRTRPTQWGEPAPWGLWTGAGQGECPAPVYAVWYYSNRHDSISESTLADLFGGVYSPPAPEPLPTQEVTPMAADFSTFPDYRNYPDGFAYNTAIGTWMGGKTLTEEDMVTISQKILDGQNWYLQQGGDLPPGHELTPDRGIQPIGAPPGAPAAVAPSVRVTTVGGIPGEPWQPRGFSLGWLRLWYPGGNPFGGGFQPLVGTSMEDYFNAPGGDSTKAEIAKFLLGAAADATADAWCCAVPEAFRGGEWWQNACASINCQGGGGTNGGSEPRGGTTSTYGAVAPRIVTRRIRICPTDANGVRYRLGKDGMCHPNLSDKQRLYPSRRGKVTKGEWNSLQKAKRAAKKFDSVEKTLAEISKATKPNVRTRTKRVCLNCGKNPCQCRIP